MSFIVKGLNCPEGCNRCYFEFEENGVHKCKVVYHGVTEKVRKFAYGRLGECPLEDAEGRWIPIYNKRGTEITVRCSICCNSPWKGHRSEFCPNCGAKMKGAEDD